MTRRCPRVPGAAGLGTRGHLVGSWDPDPQNSLRDRRGCGPELGDPSEGQQVWGPQFASGTGGGSSHLEQMETFHKEMSPASSRSAQALTTPSSAVTSGTVHIIPAAPWPAPHGARSPFSLPR